MNLQREQLPGRQLADFRSRYTRKCVYSLASHLWAYGNVSFQEGLRVAEEAFKEVPCDP